MSPQAQTSPLNQNLRDPFHINTMLLYRTVDTVVWFQVYLVL